MGCVEPGCTRPIRVRARQICNAHYRAMQRAGDLTPLDRFSARIEKGSPDECWEWLGGKEKGGYGKWGGRLAHRIAWERAHGPIPVGLTIDHLCRNHGCVNPSHLRLLTPSENFSDNGWRGRTECIRGHRWSAENTRWRTRDGKSARTCRACDRQRQAEYAARRKGKP